MAAKLIINNNICKKNCEKNSIITKIVFAAIAKHIKILLMILC